MRLNGRSLNERITMTDTVIFYDPYAERRERKQAERAAGLFAISAEQRAKDAAECVDTPSERALYADMPHTLDERNRPVPGRVVRRRRGERTVESLDRQLDGLRNYGEGQKVLAARGDERAAGRLRWARERYAAVLADRERRAAQDAALASMKRRDLARHPYIGATLTGEKPDLFQVPDSTVDTEWLGFDWFPVVSDPDRALALYRRLAGRKVEEIVSAARPDQGELRCIRDALQLALCQAEAELDGLPAGHPFDPDLDRDRWSTSAFAHCGESHLVDEDDEFRSKVETLQDWGALTELQVDRSSDLRIEAETVTGFEPVGFSPWDVGMTGFVVEDDPTFVVDEVSFLAYYDELRNMLTPVEERRDWPMGRDPEAEHHVPDDVVDMMRKAFCDLLRRLRALLDEQIGLIDQAESQVEWAAIVRSEKSLRVARSDRLVAERDRVAASCRRHEASFNGKDQ